jgi:hypothetical protein
MLADREEFSQMLREAREGPGPDVISEGDGYSSMEIPEPKVQEEEAV